jgi:transcriptional regulator with XRE-family HTH domain
MSTLEDVVGDSRFLLRQDTIRRVLVRFHLTHQQLADHLGLSRSYWSQLFNRHRSLTPASRQALLASQYLEGVGEDELWDVLS